MTGDQAETYRATPRDRIAALVAGGDIEEAARLQYGYTVGSVLGRLAWGTMTYTCNGQATSTSCGYRRKVYLGLGVEGPAPLKDEDEYVPAPFVAGTCPGCGGSLIHTSWREDEDWWPSLRLIPDDAARFVVPSPVKSADYASRGYSGAQLLESGEFA